MVYERQCTFHQTFGLYFNSNFLPSSDFVMPICLPTGHELEQNDIAEVGNELNSS